MWVPWPETPAGGLALEGEHLLRERLPRATALLCGSGMGAEPETLALIESIAGSATCPLVLDADALRPQIVTAALRRKTGGENATAGGSEKNPPALVLLPHAGEYERITPALPSAKTAALAKAFTIETPLPANVVIARKGAPTIVEGNDDSPDETISVVVCAGGPVLARGGSGDLLAGITGALCARFAARHGIFQPVLDAVALHAAAGDHLAASAHPETVRITDLLDQLGCCL
jgi:NAD(P)H-hydrate epimerase